ncbi:hypothetical protein Pan97_29990 [Bremerella volcania]|uniref:Uncharacterized protein n=1 Tax=Bremerella volcania TaxID=2527984 RepID=A0A518C9Q3_9BACT|nr:DUF5682 family protein [Bremerella volcania]QDU75955.1 hypothetical protein Pan97_29990 [Bremerella volcania]
MSWQIPVFGVRHLSPMGAWQLRAYLDEIRPEVILVEGIDDATPLVGDMTRKTTHPPIAILAYTDTLPVRTIVTPFARYSPEYQAILWAAENKVEAQFFDLPSECFLGLIDAEYERRDKERREALEAAEKETAETEFSDPDEIATPLDQPKLSLYQRVARQAGETDFETYWERHFEHNLAQGSYRGSSYEFGAAVRDLEEAQPHWRAENLVREAYMRRRIQQTIDDGTPPEKIVAVVGAFHAPVLRGDLPAMTDEELASLRRRSSKLTLMPYSYFKLSSQSGYGAGNRAPAYFELLWRSLNEGNVRALSHRYLSQVATNLRNAGTHRSTAEVIEGVRLAETLSALNGGHAPTLTDLRDAAVTLLGHGELTAVKDALVRVDVGTEIGELPEGVSQTSIQADFERELKRLKLSKYKTAVQQTLDLDLRENRQVSSEEAAFLDLNRSSLFHRLRMLDVPFATWNHTRQQSTTWAERWVVQWTPESEIALVEAVLEGETILLATAFRFNTLLEKSRTIADAAKLVNDACQCGMMEAMDQARQRLQELSSGTSDFVAIARAAFELAQVVRYGNVRRFDPEPLIPLIEELFVEASLALYSAANCDDSAAASLLEAIDQVNRVGLEFAERVEESLWTDRLQQLADSDDRNPLLSGYACALLLERGLIPNEALSREVSRRLSPGVPADLGAGWFEGLAQRNRYALLARQTLWEQLAEYVASLDDDQFKRALVFLRRAFAQFLPRERRQICENLAEHWGLNRDETAELLEAPLSDEEEEKLSDLNEFDFDDF